METRDKEKIRQAVREQYGKIARRTNGFPVISSGTSCCSPPSISDSPEQATSCCGAQNFNADQVSAALGYSKADITGAPEGANLGLGCGNPVALASLKPGETVVDLGSGGGFDCFLAAKKVGKAGKVIGVDMTPDMVSKARKNAEKMGTANVEFRLGEIEHLPVADNRADIIISNCVINLSPDKRNVYREAFRVLKPGGRLAISDIVATAPLPQQIRENLAAVTGCIGGAATIADTEKILKAVGFENIQIKFKEESRQLISNWAPGENAGDYIVSANIEAVKPG